ncbi:hypothetical protein O7635_26280 [Asanoa sp. WMMD1127]|uniref:hypothetical protein n=1 Tax=Asanoa sp. WMMD1127 TaxID=3016107 RepID=UPI00241760DF|nr:hypothetical protein [Asanoa sp. WMMD1127]MDG4825369.1 hypothetical protein [Asanoa sp. WMMD1127]
MTARVNLGCSGSGRPPLPAAVPPLPWALAGAGTNAPIAVPAPTRPAPASTLRRLGVSSMITPRSRMVRAQ